MNYKGLIFWIIALVVLFSFSKCKKENKLPTCTITYPNNGDIFEQGDTITISVEADDQDGLIAEVRFYIDDMWFISSTSFPYAYSWHTINEKIGNRAIKVIANDNDGGSKTDRCIISIIGDATIITTDVSSVTHNSAVSGGNITNDGGTIITGRGVCWNIFHNPVITNDHTSNGSGSGSFASSITGLSPNTKYYVRAYATNSVGTAYGNEISFQTSQLLKLPTLTTKSVIYNIKKNSAQSGGDIDYDGGTQVTSRGVCWSTSQTPTILNDHTIDGSGTGSFTSSLSGFIKNTTYYVRAYAINSVGTAYGNEISFQTWYGSVTDSDGNVYPVVQIGTQVWMAENLKTTKYNDSADIPLITNSTEWYDFLTPGYCWYNNDEAGYKNTYGALYNWKTVNTGKLCPTGWHVPTDSEWTTLTDCLGGTTIAGMKLKEVGTTHWDSPNTGATNESRFTALPGGYRGRYGTFNDIGYYGHWWSSSEYTMARAYFRYLSYNSAGIIRYYHSKRLGLSVRCIRDY
jgi:uncharacterized protein (TIGR02145 family)